MPIEFAERIRRIPVYPAADGYSLSGDVAMLASNETPFAPMQPVQDAIARALGRAGALRVTVGTEGENQKFLGALGDVLA